MLYPTNKGQRKIAKWSNGANAHTDELWGDPHRHLGRGISPYTASGCYLGAPVVALWDFIKGNVQIGHFMVPQDFVTVEDLGRREGGAGKERGKNTKTVRLRGQAG